MRLFISICIGVLCHFGGQAQMVDGVIAIVGNQAIMVSDVEEELAMVAAQRGTLPEGYSCSTLERQFLSKLLILKAEQDSVQVTDDQIEADLNKRMDQILRTMNNDPAKFQEYYGETVQQRKESMRDELKDYMLIQQMQNAVLGSVQVTPKEIRAFFNRIPQDSLPYFNAEAQVGEIVMKPILSEASKQDAQNTIADLRKKIQTNENTFEELAKQYSDDRGSARFGGNLGFQKRGQYVPEFEAAAYNLDVGELSDAVETKFGYHLIELLERRGNQLNLRHILIRPKITEDDIQLTMRKMDTVRQNIISDSMRFESAVLLYSDRESFSRANGGMLINPKTAQPSFETGELDYNIYFAIDTMTIGDYSLPIRYTDESGDEMVRIVSLRGKTEPHVANLVNDYDRIQAAALNEKRDIELQRWMRKKMKTVEVSIHESYRSCPNISTLLKHTK